MDRKSIAGLAGGVFLLAGCGGGGTAPDGGAEAGAPDGGGPLADAMASDGTFDASPDAPSDAAMGGSVRPVFEPASFGEGATVFFDFPYPSDLRTDERGHPMMDGFPRASLDVLAAATALVEDERPGFSPLGTTYFRFTGALDPRSLPGSPEGSLDEGATVLLVDVDPASPRFGERVPVFVSFRDRGDGFWPSNVLTLRPVPGLAMWPGTRYAAVVRTGVRGAGGGEVEPHDGFEALKVPGGGDAPLEMHHRALFDALEMNGIGRAEVLVATSFTTSDPAAEMEALREFVHGIELPPVTGWTVGPTTSTYTTYRGTFDTVALFSGEAPYGTFGEGRFRFDGDGVPIDQSPRTVELAITVPNAAPPAGGFPLVVYGHGTGGDESSHVGTGREGPVLAAEGLATLGFEAALHGQRLEGELDVEQIVVENPIAGREMIRQTVVDMMLLYRMAEAGALEVPSSVTGGDPVSLATEPGLYMGHSQGAQEAGLLLGVEPSVDAAFFSEGGGSALISIFERDFMGQRIVCLIGLLVGISQCDDLTMDHPVMTLVQQLVDPAEPLVFAHRFWKERPVGHPAPHIVMTEGTADTYTPAGSVEALAAAIGLPIVTPVVQTTTPYELLGSPTTTTPAEANVMLGDGVTVTGGLLQYDGGSHFVIYELAEARAAYAGFLATAAQGSAVIPAR